MQRSFSFSFGFLTPTVPGLDMVFFGLNTAWQVWHYSKGCDRGREFHKLVDSSAEEPTRVLTDESIHHSADCTNATNIHRTNETPSL
jgi:hypothetical protein